MSNQAIIDIRKFDDDVIVLAEDNYGKTFLSYEPEVFAEMTLPDLLSDVAATNEMAESFWVEESGEVVLECCTSLEVHGFDDEVQVFTR